MRLDDPLLVLRDVLRKQTLHQAERGKGLLRDHLFQLLARGGIHPAGDALQELEAKRKPCPGQGEHEVDVPQTRKALFHSPHGVGKTRFLFEQGAGFY